MLQASESEEKRKCSRLAGAAGWLLACGALAMSMRRSRCRCTEPSLDHRERWFAWQQCQAPEMRPTVQGVFLVCRAGSSQFTKTVLDDGIKLSLRKFARASTFRRAALHQVCMKGGPCLYKLEESCWCKVLSMMAWSLSAEAGARPLKICTPSICKSLARIVHNCAMSSCPSTRRTPEPSPTCRLFCWISLHKPGFLDRVRQYA